MKQHLLIIIICLITTTSCKTKKHTKQLDITANSVTASKSQLDFILDKIKKVDYQSNSYFLYPINEDENIQLHSTDSGLAVRNAVMMHNRTESTTSERSALQGQQKEEKKEEQALDITEHEEEEIKVEGSYNRVFVLLLIIVLMYIINRKI